MYIVYGLLALFLLGPLLLPGYVVTLDMVFVPHPPLPPEITNTYVFQAALHFLSNMLPGDVLQKIVLLAIFFFAAVGAHKLVAQVLPVKTEQVYWAPYIAGIFYVCNPFVYGRFMAGQYLVLLGYAFLPFFVRSLLVFLQSPSMRHALLAAGWLLAISMVSIHTIGLAVLLAVVCGVVYAWQHRRDRAYLLRTLKYGAAVLGLWTVLSAYWLVPLLLGSSVTAQEINTFDASDSAAFATDGGLFNVLMLKGFWAEAQGLFVTADSILPLSGLVQTVIWVVISVGVVRAWRQQRTICVVFGASALVAAVLALCQPLMTWLAAHIFIFAGYREPHKFVAVVALAFAVFMAIGAVAILQKIAVNKKPFLLWLAVGGLVLLPLVNTPTMFGSFAGQLAPRQYPADWYDVNLYLNTDTQQYNTLFLPWHLYMPFRFTGRVVANPASKFFSKPIFTSDNVEFAGIRSHTLVPEKRMLENSILPNANQGTTLGAQLAPLRIKYVVLAKDADYINYQYLDSQSDLTVVRDTLNLKVYRNMAFGER